MLNQFFQTVRSRLPNTLAAGRTVILTSAVVTAAVVGLRELGMLQSLELRGFDQLVRMRPDEKPDSRILVVGITEEDLRANAYPLPNKTLQQLLDKLEEYEPRAIGLDIIRDASVKGDREQLLQFMKESPSLVAVCKIRDDTLDKTGEGFPPPEGLEPDQIGAANLGVDPDGVLRRALLVITPPNINASATSQQAASICDDSRQAIPYLGLQLVIRYLEAEKVPLVLEPDKPIQLGAATLKPLEAKTGPYRDPYIGGKRGYQLMINFRAARTPAPEVTLTDVLSGKVPADQIKDRIVLIGYTARSVKDELFTPYGQKQNLPPLPGVVAHAQVTSQLLSAALDKRPLIWFWSPWLEGLWVLGWSVFGGLLAWRLRHPMLLVGAIAISSAGLFGIGYGLFTQAGWIPLVPTELAFLLTAGGVVIFSRGVAQAIYEGVKGFLKLDIEIDVAKKEQEVAEITESDYFRQLQTKSEKLKRQKDEPLDNELPIPEPSKKAAKTQIQPIETRIQSTKEPNDPTPLPNTTPMIDPRQPNPKPPFKIEIPDLSVDETQPTQAIQPTQEVQLEDDLAYLQQVKRRSDERREQRKHHTEPVVETPQQEPPAEPPVKTPEPDELPAIWVPTPTNMPTNLNIEFLQLFGEEEENQHPVSDLQSLAPMLDEEPAIPQVSPVNVDETVVNPLTSSTSSHEEEPPSPDSLAATPLPDLPATPPIADLEIGYMPFLQAERPTQPIQPPELPPVPESAIPSEIPPIENEHPPEEVASPAIMMPPMEMSSVPPQAIANLEQEFIHAPQLEPPSIAIEQPTPPAQSTVDSPAILPPKAEDKQLSPDQGTFATSPVATSPDSSSTESIYAVFPNQPSDRPPAPAQSASITQLLQEVDAYYQQLKQS